MNRDMKEDISHFVIPYKTIFKYVSFHKTFNFPPLVKTNMPLEK
jgi:hypothetical protein